MFIEAVTYRWRGHVGHREDNDVGVDREVDLSLWKKRDPIMRLHQAMELLGYSDSDYYESLWERYRSEIEEVWLKASAAEFPAANNLLDWVYGSTTAKD